MDKVFITIGRQYGSGGHAIGQALSQRLHIPLYDRELIELSSKKSGIEAGTLSIHDERTSSASQYRQPEKKIANSVGGVLIVDTLFEVESQIILDLADQGSCILIGRAADYVLRHRPELVSVFITAPFPQRVKRIMDRNHMCREDAAEAVSRVDSRRSAYYHHYTGKQWGSPESYQLILDSSFLGIEGTAQRLEEILSSPASG